MWVGSQYQSSMCNYSPHFPHVNGKYPTRALKFARVILCYENKSQDCKWRGIVFEQCKFARMILRVIDIWDVLKFVKICT